MRWIARAPVTGPIAVRVSTSDSDMGAALTAQTC